MGIASDLALFMRKASAITGVVSGKTVGVYAGAVPQKTAKGVKVEPPLILVTTLEHDNFLTIDGTGGVATGTRKATLDIDCKGRTEQEADTIRQEVEEILDDYSGAAGESVIDAIDLTDLGEDTEPPAHGEGLPVFVKTIEAEVIYSPE